MLHMANKYFSVFMLSVSLPEVNKKAPIWTNAKELGYSKRTLTGEILHIAHSTASVNYVGMIVGGGGHKEVGFTLQENKDELYFQ